MEKPYFAILCADEREAVALLAALKETFDEVLGWSEVVREQSEKRAELYYEEDWGDTEYDKHLVFLEISGVANEHIARTSSAILFTASKYHPAEYFLCWDALTVYTQVFDLVIWLSAFNNLVVWHGLAGRTLQIGDEMGYVLTSKEFTGKMLDEGTRRDIEKYRKSKNR